MFDFFKRKKKNPLDELKGLVGNFELISFPAAVMNVLEMLRDPESTISEIASQIEMDPGMHVKVLKMVNAAGFGLAKKVSNLQHAVTIMGRSRLESMVLTIAVAGSIPPAMACMPMADFWRGSARRACLARLLAQHIHAATQAESFTAGLLQDIGMVVMDQTNPQLYGAIFRKWHGDAEARIDELERAHFGFDHAAVGALMAESWGLPEYLIQAIGAHHLPWDQSPAEQAVQLVAMLKYQAENDGSDALIGAATNPPYGIDETLLSEMITRAFDDAGQFASLFSSK
ncbi:MAG: HDOD domain-containing protein [Proteobacteria bacterium]|nr:HDOD domain-containing protein [Pseudomonadota bacterium]MBU1688535.1 HDOD domain-containing protein [Pseudomonadota bacterium]